MKRVREEKIPTTLPTAAGKRAVAKTEWYHQAVVAPGFPADGKLLWVSSKWGDHAAPERHGCSFTALFLRLSICARSGSSSGSADGWAIDCATAAEITG